MGIGFYRSTTAIVRVAYEELMDLTFLTNEGYQGSQTPLEISSLLLHNPDMDSGMLGDGY